MTARIADVTAFEALDSRGTPTVAAIVTLDDGTRARAIVPSGASTGAHEARELRDGGTRYDGKGVDRAVASVMGPLRAAVRGIPATDQRDVDRALRDADGTPDLARLGANAVLAVSVATARSAAAATGVALHEYLGGRESPLLPMPMVNILSGGAHAGRTLDLQDFLVVPIGARSFRDAIEVASRVRVGTVQELAARGMPSALVADEGGLGPALDSHRAALELLIRGIERAGLEPGTDAAIAIDVAATQFALADGRYAWAAEDRVLTAGQLVAELRAWADEFPIVSYEDVLAEDDWEHWAEATAALGDVQLLGDDLFVTTRDRLDRGIRDQVANAVLVKPNQVGTLTDALDVVTAARAAGYATVLSARSGETEDDWLADLAVGWRTGQIKVGSTMRSERTAKWNRLLEIEAQLPGTEFARFPAPRSTPPVG